jgi:hypothetical protein
MMLNFEEKAATKNNGEQALTGLRGLVNLCISKKKGVSRKGCICRQIPVAVSCCRRLALSCSKAAH